MRAFLVASCGAGLLGLAGCGGAASYVHSDTTTLGRVVVYRNGVAYFERYAKVDDDKLTLAVPPDKVDDFLKSLTVVDAKTGEPTPISYPTDTSGANAAQGAAGLIDMQIELAGNRPHELRLSYVTEAPAWKPSYRVVLRDDKKVDLVGLGHRRQHVRRRLEERAPRRRRELGAVVPVRSAVGAPRRARDAAVERPLRAGAADGRRPRTAARPS